MVQGGRWPWLRPLFKRIQPSVVRVVASKGFYRAKRWPSITPVHARVEIEAPTHILDVAYHMQATAVANKRSLDVGGCGARWPAVMVRWPFTVIYGVKHT